MLDILPVQFSGKIWEQFKVDIVKFFVRRAQRRSGEYFTQSVKKRRKLVIAFEIPPL
jgi:hypothetical protein